MKLTFRFLGRFSEDMVGISMPDDVPDNLCVRELRAVVAEKAPAIAERLNSCLVAVNTEYVDNDQALKDGDEVAFLPPVSGG